MNKLHRKAILILLSIAIVITFIPSLAFADSTQVTASLKDNNGSSGFLSYSNKVDDEITYNKKTKKYFLDVVSGINLEQLAKLCSTINKASPTMAKSIKLTGSYNLVFNFNKDIKLESSEFVEDQLMFTFEKEYNNHLFTMTDYDINYSKKTVKVVVTLNSNITCADFAKYSDDCNVFVEFPEDSVYVPGDKFKEGKNFKVMSTSYSGNINLDVLAKYRTNVNLVNALNQSNFKDSKGLSLTAVDKAILTFSNTSDANSTVPMVVNEFSEDKDDKKDGAVRKFNVSIDWEGNDEEIPSEVIVQLYRDGKAFGTPVKINSSMKWKYSWKNLSNKYEWTCDELRIPTSFEKKIDYSFGSRDESNNMAEVGMYTTYCTISHTFTKKGAIGTVGLSVAKEWDDGAESWVLDDGTLDEHKTEIKAALDEVHRPEEISIQLYKDGQAFGKPVTLTLENSDGDTNRWGYYFSGLDPKSKWTCDEVDVPKGYSKKIESNGTNIIITNTAEKRDSDNTHTKAKAKPNTKPAKAVKTTSSFKSPDTSDNKSPYFWLTSGGVAILLLVLSLIIAKRKKLKLNQKEQYK